MNQKPRSNENLSHILRSLALLLHAGLTAADGVSLLAQEDKGYGLEAIGAGLDAGQPLSEMLDSHGGFPPAVSALVRIGEETGRLEEALLSLADYYDRRHRTGKLLKNAVAYPAMTLGLMLVVVGVLLVKVLPIFDGVYASLGSRLTGAAAGLLHLGQLLKAALPALLLVLGLTAVLAVLFAGCRPFRDKVTRWYQKNFGDRGISRKFSNARFAQGLAMGLGSGLSLEESARLAAMLLQDIPGAAKRAARCQVLLEQGASLAEALAEERLLDEASCRMLQIGLRGGNADAVMADIAQRQMDGAEEALDAAIAKIEPALVLTASVLVGLILLSVMLPLMDILSVLG